MSFTYEDRLSDSPFIETIWHTQTEDEGCYTALADGTWDIVIRREKGKFDVSLYGPSSRAVAVPYTAGTDTLGIRFKHGTFMPDLPSSDIVDSGMLLPEATGRGFWLGGYRHELPNFENVEAFVARLVRRDLVAQDTIVQAVLRGQSNEDVSLRSVQRRFLRSTGLSYRYLQQIERARRAAELLQQGTPILDAVFELGYTDQSHLTKSLRQFIGQTPAQILKTIRAE